MGDKLKDDGYCFVCGKSNPYGLGLEFKQTDHGVTASFCADRRFQGYKGIVHGGIIAALLDEASVKALLLRGIKAVTAEINLRFKNPLSVNEEAIVNADIVQSHGKLHVIRAEIVNSGSKVIAHSMAKLFRYDE
ncbi:thioesterase superfamily protein [bacterium BMS3Abin07]|nr:thioesterase superfamily protein [bacterium BMS3Abin07]GBE32706.1 thioesterase superfamily protein [bacterium BMS3Bbin05]